MVIEVFINLELVSIGRLMSAVQNRWCEIFKVEQSESFYFYLIIFLTEGKISINIDLYVYIYLEK